MISIIRTALLGAFLSAGVTLAEWTPTRPVHIVVGYAPGGQPDVIARVLAEPLSRALGQPVVIDNRIGAGGNLGAESVAKAAPDGYTLLMGTNGPLTVSPSIYRNLGYDPLRDFAPVTLVGSSPNLIAVNPALGVTSLRQLIDAAKTQPGRLNYSSVGRGSVSHLSMVLLNALAGMDTVHIPYNGGAPAVTALVAGDVQILSLNSTMIVPQLEAGKVRVLAQTSRKRSALVPAVPTVAEFGYPEFEADVWMAILAPAKTPPEVIARLNAELVKIIRDPAMKQAVWDRQWIDPAGGPPEEVTAILKRDNEKWARIIREQRLVLE